MQLLHDYGQPDSNESGTGMAWMSMPLPIASMPGMATPEQLATLKAATGIDADRQYAQLMLNHHLGGVHMAEYAAEHASEHDVKVLAQSMVTGQQSDINELRGILTRLHQAADAQPAQGGVDVGPGRAVRGDGVLQPRTAPRDAAHQLGRHAHHDSVLVRATDASTATSSSRTELPTSNTSTSTPLLHAWATARQFVSRRSPRRRRRRFRAAGSSPSGSPTTQRHGRRASRRRLGGDRPERRAS